jgi:hypothetical protein
LRRDEATSLGDHRNPSELLAHRLRASRAQKPIAPKCIIP